MVRYINLLLVTLQNPHDRLQQAKDECQHKSTQCDPKSLLDRFLQAHVLQPLDNRLICRQDGVIMTDINHEPKSNT